MKIQLFALALIATAGTASASSLRSEIETMNRAVLRSMMKQDISMFVRLEKGNVTPDFKYTESGQSLDFDTMVKMMKKGFAMYTKMVSATTKTIKVTENGKTGTSMSIHHTAGKIMGADKKSHLLVVDGKSSGTYVKVNGKWMMSGMHWLSTKMTMDGKPMAPEKMGEPK